MTLPSAGNLTGATGSSAAVVTSFAIASRSAGFVCQASQAAVMYVQVNQGCQAVRLCRSISSWTSSAALTRSATM